MKTLKNILIIQSRVHQDAARTEQDEYVRSLGNSAHATFISSLDAAHPWMSPQKMLAGFDAVVLGGSGDFDFDGGRLPEDPARAGSYMLAARLRPLIHHALSEDFPMLGICYGHQLVAEVAGVRVQHSEDEKKRGTFDVQLTDEGTADAVFSQLPGIFAAQYGHKDSVSRLPEGATVLARSPQCRLSALRYGKRVYTMQFHPELTHDDLAKKIQKMPDYVAGTRHETRVRPSAEASTIIPLFVERIVRESVPPSVYVVSA